MKVLTILFCPKEKKKSKRWARAGRGCSTKRCLSLPWVSLRAASHQRACWVTRGWQCSLCLQSSRTPLLGEGGHITETKPPSAGPSARPKKKHLFPLFYQIRVPSLIGEVSNQKWGIKQFNHLSLNSKACRCPHVIKKKKRSESYGSNLSDKQLLGQMAADRRSSLWAPDGGHSHLLAHTPRQFNHSVPRELLI